MKTFALPERSRLKITKVTPRKETHGKDLVQAISLRCEWWPTENSALNLLDDGLQDMLFWTPPEVAAQCQLDGIPAVKKHRRVPAAAMPIKVEASFTGYTMTIEHGIDESSALELYASTLDKFDAEAREGGSSVIRWSLASNKTITPELVGALCALEGTEVIATLTPPKPEAAPIDGTNEAFERDHPEAGDLFSAEHGGDGYLGEDHEEEAAQLDGEGPDEDDGDSEGGEADAEAEFEAGVKARLAEAGVEPVTRSTRTARGRERTKAALAAGQAS
jgi:hypothetical protein